MAENSSILTCDAAMFDRNIQYKGNLTSRKFGLSVSSLNAVLEDTRKI